MRHFSQTALWAVLLNLKHNSLLTESGSFISVSLSFPLLPPQEGRSTNIFDRTLQLFNRSPQPLRSRSFSSPPRSWSSPNVPKRNFSLGENKRRPVTADLSKLRMSSFGFGGGAPATNALAEIGPELPEVNTSVRLYALPSEILEPATNTLLSL